MGRTPDDRSTIDDDDELSKVLAVESDAQAPTGFFKSIIWGQPPSLYQPPDKVFCNLSQTPHADRAGVCIDHQRLPIISETNAFIPCPDGTEPTVQSPGRLPGFKTCYQYTQPSDFGFDYRASLARYSKAQQNRHDFSYFAVYRRHPWLD